MYGKRPVGAFRGMEEEVEVVEEEMEEEEEVVRV